VQCGLGFAADPRPPPTTRPLSPEIANLPFVDDCICLSQNAIDGIYSMAVSFSALPDELKCAFVETMVDLSSRVLHVAQATSSALSPQAKNNTKAVLYFLSAVTAKVEQACKGDGLATALAGHSAPAKCHGSDDDDDGDFAAPAAAPKKGRGGKAAASKGGKAKAGAKKGGAGGDFSWVDYRPTLLDIIARAADLESNVLWTMGIVPESFLSAMWGYVLLLLETRPAGVGGTGGAEAATRALCTRIVLRCTTLMAQSANGPGAAAGSGFTTLCTAMLDALLRSESFAQCSADLCSKAPQALSSELLGEISRMNLASLPALGVKNVGTFIESLAKANPQLMTSQLPVVMKQLDSAAHQIRSSLLQAMGLVIAHIHKTCTAAEAAAASGNAEADLATAAEAPADQGEKKVGNDNEDDEDDEEDAESAAARAARDAQDFRKNPQLLPRVRNSLLDMLVERTHDVSPYSRAAVLKVWQSLLESDAVPARRVGSIAEIAVDRLQDKAAAVRKAALSLLTSLLDLNPFGGQLDKAYYEGQRSALEEAFTARVLELKEIATPQAGDEDDDEEGEAVAGGAKNGGAKGKTTKGKAAVLSAVVEEDDEADKTMSSEAAAAVAVAVAGPTALKGLEEDDPFLQSADVNDDAQIAAIRIKLDFVSSALEMIGAVGAAMPRVIDMTASKTSGDVVEALRFLTRAVNFQITGAVRAFQKTFSLVFHADTTIRTECLTAFKNVFLTDGAAEHPLPLPPAEVARNLLSICRSCDTSSSASMEEIVGVLFQSGEVDEAAVTALWSFVSPAGQGQGQGSNELAAPGMRVLAIIATHCPSLLTPARVAAVLEAGLSSRALGESGNGCSPDFAAMKAACQVLQRCPAATSRSTANNNTAKAAEAAEQMSAALLQCAPGLVHVLSGAMCRDDEDATRSWFGACEEAMHALFHIHPSPDRVLASVIVPMYASLATPPPSDDASGAAGSAVVCSAARLSRLLFVLGQAALNSLVYAERLSVLSKKAIAAAAAAGVVVAAPVANVAEAEDAPTTKKGGKGKKAAAAAAPPVTEKDEAALEDEMGMAAAADADAERQFLLLTERELVMSNLLGKFHPIVAFVVANQVGTFSSPLLRESALLALCRIMSVSSILCEQYLPLLFTVLETETSDACRTTIMIALGDLAFRFPNALEPWTQRMYARLGDPSVLVRYNALMVLTHLILNDMVKVKGQVTHVVMCLTDGEERVRELATLFFNKLSERSNNPIYNLLGDIIGTLSSGQTRASAAAAAGNGAQTENAGAVTVAAVDNSTSLPSRALCASEFQKTMSFLLGFVKKDKQADGMLERLLARLAMAQSLRQRRCLAYCISELTISEKGVRRMAECVKVCMRCASPSLANFLLSHTDSLTSISHSF